MSQEGIDACIVEGSCLAVGLVVTLDTAPNKLCKDARCGVSEDVAVGHMIAILIGLDDDAGDHERGASEFEEVVGGSDLIDGEDRGEDVAEEPLNIIGRGYVATLCSLYDGFGQGTTVYLLILIERYAVNLHGSSRHHIRRFAAKDEVVERLDVNLLRTDDIGSYVLASVGVVECLHGGILDAWELTYDSLDLLEFDAETTHLDLSVATTHKLYVAVRKVAHDVACAVNAGVGLRFEI